MSQANVLSTEVGANGMVAVTERIRYHFDTPRHGIFRFIPLYYPLDSHDARKLEIEDHSATMDGQPVSFVRDDDASAADENWILRMVTSTARSPAITTTSSVTESGPAQRPGRAAGAVLECPGQGQQGPGRPR